MSQIMFLNIMIRGGIFNEFLDLWFRKAKDVVEQLAVGMFERMPFIRLGVDCHITQGGNDFRWFPRGSGARGHSTGETWTAGFR